MTRRPRLWLVLVTLVVAGGWWAVQTVLDRASATLRERLKAELAKEGLIVEVGDISLDLRRGVTARDIRLTEAGASGPELLRVDELALEMEMTEWFDKRSVSRILRKITLSRANLRLPVDPQQPDGDRLELSEVSSRLSLREGVVEIEALSGLLAGKVLLQASGTVELNAPKRARDPKLRQRTPKEQIDALRAQRQALAKLTGVLGKFTFEGKPPVVSLALNGSIRDLDALEATLNVESGALRYGTGTGWRAEELKLAARLERGSITVTPLRIKDAKGSIQGEIRWDIGSPTLPFTLKSTADLPGLVQAIFDDVPVLREVVVYDQTPKIDVSGILRLTDAPSAEKSRNTASTGAPAAPATLKIDEMEGEIAMGQFATRGAIFEALQGRFFTKGDDVHLRGLHLAHRTGTLSGRMMKHQGKANYELQLQMDPSVAAPLMTDVKVKQFLEQLTFGTGSAILVTASGSGPADQKLSAPGWTHEAEIDARDFAFRGTAAHHLETRATYSGQKLTARQIRIERAEGTVTAPELTIDFQQGLLALHGVKSTVWPVPIIQTFNQRVANEVNRYPFSQPPEVTMDGVVDLRGIARSDYYFNLKVPGGEATYPLSGQAIALLQPHGKITVKKDILGLNLRSEVKAGTTYAGATFQGKPMVTFSGDVDLIPADGNATQWKMVIAAPGRTDYQLLGKSLPLDDLSTSMTFSRQRLDFNHISAQVYGGEVVGTGLLDWNKGVETYTAAIEARGLSFGQLAQLYAPTYSTEGTITGGFRFAGRLDNSVPIRGSGSMVVENGNIFAIPILGPLSPVLSLVLPGTKSGYGVAREAKCSFTVSDNLFATKDFTAQTGLFNISADGVINMANKGVKLNASTNTRGPAGVIFYTLGQLFAFEANGNLDDPKWTPKLLSIPMKILPGARRDPVGSSPEN